jgi:hypothetical protein
MKMTSLVALAAFGRVNFSITRQFLEHGPGQVCIALDSSESGFGIDKSCRFHDVHESALHKAKEWPTRTTSLSFNMTSEGSSSQPVPSDLIFLYEVAKQATGSKVRFLGW